MQRTPCKTHASFEPCDFGTEVCGDTIITNAEYNWGLDGEENAVVLYDRGSKWTGGYPTATKTHLEAVEAMNHFVGPGGKILRFYSDKAPELVRAAHDKGICHDTATPGRPDTNGVAERIVQKVVEGTKAVLYQAGMENHWWPKGMEHFCFFHKQ